MKIKNSYDSCYIHKVSCPLHNFFTEKLGQANLSFPLPLGSDGSMMHCFSIHFFLNPI